MSFVGSAVFVGLIRKREDKPERQPDAHFGREIAEGFNFVVAQPDLALDRDVHRVIQPVLVDRATMFLVMLARELRLGAGFIGVVFSFSPSAGWLARSPRSDSRSGWARAAISGSRSR